MFTYFKHLLHAVCMEVFVTLPVQISFALCLQLVAQSLVALSVTNRKSEDSLVQGLVDLHIVFHLSKHRLTNFISIIEIYPECLHSLTVDFECTELVSYGLIESITSIGSRVTISVMGDTMSQIPVEAGAETGMWHHITRDRDLSLWIWY